MTRLHRRKPESKLNDLIEAIKTQDISDDDLKKIGDALAAKIEKGAAPRVGSKLATAVRKAHKKRALINLNSKKRSPAEKLWRRLQQGAEELQLLIDGSMPVEGESDKKFVQGIRQLMPGYICRAHKLGVDVLKVYYTLVVPNRELNQEKREQNEQIIDVEFR
ncbi:MAG: hypothetical protein JRJ75_16680 [Deltaproteobacteria bacterium]|nr:hypothetical protein [Deltaproteobacteria bacterium]